MGNNRFVPCQHCKKTIVFQKTAKGNYMPCDTPSVFYKPDANGKDTILNESGNVVKGWILEDRPPGCSVGYQPHFISCTYRKEQNPKKQNTPQIEQTSLFKEELTEMRGNQKRCELCDARLDPQEKCNCTDPAVSAVKFTEPEYTDCVSYYEKHGLKMCHRHGLAYCIKEGFFCNTFLSKTKQRKARQQRNAACIAPQYAI